MFSISSSSCPFAAGGMITDPRFFVGRTEQLDLITHWMTADLPICVNVVGGYRIGKSSLLYHIFQTYEQRVQRYGKNASDYVGIYLSLESVRCWSDFYRSIAYELRQRPSVQANQALTAPFTTSPLKKDANFFDAMYEWRKKGVRPLLFLDKFEMLFEYPRKFDNRFYDSLCFLMDYIGIPLVVASYKPIDFYCTKCKFTSPFFGVCMLCRLSKLKESEALELVQLPTTTLPNMPCALSPEAQRQALEWGQQHPYLLQLVCYYLWNAQENNLPLNSLWKEYCFFAIFRRLFG